MAKGTISKDAAVPELLQFDTEAPEVRLQIDFDTKLYRRIDEKNSYSFSGSSASMKCRSASDTGGFRSLLLSIMPKKKILTNQSNLY